MSQLEFRTFRFHEIDPSLSTCLRFKTIISKYNRHDMKRNTSCKLVELLHPPSQCTWLAIFRITFSAFPTNTSKHANYRIIVVLDLTSHPALDPCPVKCHCQRKPGRTKRSRSAVYLHLFTVQKLSEKINNHDICRGRRSFFFEISPHHDFSLSSGLNWPKFRPTLGEPKRYFAHIPETLIFVR